MGYYWKLSDVNPFHWSKFPLKNIYFLSTATHNIEERILFTAGSCIRQIESVDVYYNKWLTRRLIQQDFN